MRSTSSSKAMLRLRPVGFVSLCLAALAHMSTAHRDLIVRDSLEPDPYSSSGACYYSEDNEADSEYIPCGNTAFGVFSCCLVGSICMDQNACYLKPNTYIAGCTDPTYSDPSCPDKGPYANQQWSGMSYCNGTSDQWTLCDDEPSGSDTPIPWPGCYCPPEESSRIIAFSAPGIVPRQIQLPSSSGGTMSFYPGYSPNTVLTSTAASTSATTSRFPSTPTLTKSEVSSGSTTTSRFSSTPTSTKSEVSSGSTTTRSHPVTTFDNSDPRATQHHRSSLGTGAKIGIGIGAGLGGSLALIVIGAMALYIRRLKKRQLSHRDEPKRPHSELLAAEKDCFSGSESAALGQSENTAELAGNGSKDLSSITSPDSSLRTWSRPMSTEMEGTIPKYSSMTSLQSQELGTDSPVYKTYNPVKELAIGVHRAPGSSNISQASYRPGRQVGDGVYKMPAHLPGSTFLD